MGKRKIARRKPTKSKQKGWMPAFLESLARTDSVTKAAEDAGINRQYAYEVREEDSGFASQWDEAKEKHCELLEAEAAKRAFAGSDTMLIFLMKNKLPSKYKDRHEFQHGFSGEPMRVKVIHDRNWYRTANGHDMPAGSNGSSATSLVESSKAQDSSGRQTLGKNRNGTSGVR